MEQSGGMNGWHKLEVVAKAIGAVLIPITIVMLSNHLSKTDKFVGMAANILSQDPRDNPSQSSKNMRKWAVDVINKYSDVPLPPDIVDDVINHVPFPVEMSPSAGTWGVVFGADKTLELARHEVTKTAKSMGIEGAQIFFRANSYRSVKVYFSHADAEDGLGKAKSKRADSYMVNMAKWCPGSTDEGSHFACKSP